MIRKTVLALGVVMAVSLVAVSSQTAHGEQTNVQISMTSEDNIFASMSFDGENIWVEIQGITVRKRFDSLESALSYVETKYESRTDQLLGNDKQLKKNLESFKQEARQKYNELYEEHQKLEKEHDSLSDRFHSFVTSVHNKFADLQKQVNWIWFILCFSVLAVSATVFIRTEMDVRGMTRRSKMKKRIEELEKKVKEQKAQ